LLDKTQEPGTYKIQWSGLNELGNNIASGLYLVRIQAGEFHAAGKMIFIR
jgi:hypothetical protein